MNPRSILGVLVLQDLATLSLDLALLGKQNDVFRLLAIHRAVSIFIVTMFIGTFTTKEEWEKYMFLVVLFLLWIYRSLNCSEFFDRLNNNKANMRIIYFIPESKNIKIFEGKTHEIEFFPSVHLVLAINTSLMVQNVSRW